MCAKVKPLSFENLPDNLLLIIIEIPGSAEIRKPPFFQFYNFPNDK